MRNLILPLFAILVFSCSESNTASKAQEQFDLAELQFESKMYSDAKIQLDSIAIEDQSFSKKEEYKALVQKVDNAIKLEEEEKAAKEKKIAENKKLIDELLNGVRVNEDDMNDIIFYTDKASTKYNDVNSFHLYIAQSKGKAPNLYLTIQYAASDWLFVENYLIKCDDEKYTIKPKDIADRDNSGGKIWEWHTLKVDDEIRIILNAIAEAKSVKLRTNGSQYYDDRDMSSKEISAIGRMLNLYDLMMFSY